MPLSFNGCYGSVVGGFAKPGQFVSREGGGMPSVTVSWTVTAGEGSTKSSPRKQA